MAALSSSAFKAMKGMRDKIADFLEDGEVIHRRDAMPHGPRVRRCAPVSSPRLFISSILSQIDRPKWMVGRAVIDNELESAYKYPEPIMTFPLYRG